MEAEVLEREEVGGMEREETVEEIMREVDKKRKEEMRREETKVEGVGDEKEGGGEGGCEFMREEAEKGEEK
jgi:hypothetical protein